MNKLINGIVTGASLIALQAVVPATASAKTHIVDPQKVTICHRTDSVTNPYVRETVSSSSVDGNSGNDNGKGDHLLEHTGPVFQKGFTHNDTWGDIIPSFDTKGKSYDSPQTSLNWNSAGQAIWNNKCKLTSGGQGGGGGTITPPSGGGQGQVLGATTSSTLPAGELANTGQNAVPSMLAGLAVLGMTGAVTLKTRKS